MAQVRKRLTPALRGPCLTCVLFSVSLLQVAQTADGVDADLWKDGLFKSKVTRYLCFTRSFSKENVSPVVAFRLLSEDKSSPFVFELLLTFLVVVYFHRCVNLSVVLSKQGRISNHCWVSFINSIINHIPKCVVNSIKTCFPEETQRRFLSQLSSCLPFIRVTNCRVV